MCWRNRFVFDKKKYIFKSFSILWSIAICHETGKAKKYNLLPPAPGLFSMPKCLISKYFARLRDFKMFQFFVSIDLVNLAPSYFTTPPLYMRFFMCSILLFIVFPQINHQSWKCNPLPPLRHFTRYQDIIFPLPPTPPPTWPKRAPARGLTFPEQT